MNSLNSILLEGNLVRDPELGHSPKGTPFCRFSIASNRFYKIEEQYQEEVSFFDVTAWARLAEVCGQYLKKGRGVRIIGRLKQDRWKGKDGKGRSKIYVIADHMEFRPAFRKKESESESESESVRAKEEKMPVAVSY